MAGSPAFSVQSWIGHHPARNGPRLPSLRFTGFDTVRWLPVSDDKHRRDRSFSDPLRVVAEQRVEDRLVAFPHHDHVGVGGALDDVADRRAGGRGFGGDLRRRDTPLPEPVGGDTVVGASPARSSPAVDGSPSVPLAHGHILLGDNRFVPANRPPV